MKTAHQIILYLMLIFFGKSKSDFRNDPWYPRYHLASLEGFMNDPNGMIFFNGYYHAFYQHTPKNVNPGGLKHWAHARSQDMVVWEHIEEALVPSINEDIDGCFSGSAIIDDRGNLNLVYTGVSTVENRTHQVQCLAVSDITTRYFRKEGKIIESNTYYENFRDPKVWKEGEFYYVVVGAMNETDNTKLGQVMLYKSPDLKDEWKPQGILAGPINNTGFMWECPDLYTINDKQILSFSFQEEKQNGEVSYKSGYLVGSWNPGKEFTIEQSFKEFDKGHDFYASQTFLAKDGRRIQVAWMNMWDTPFPESKNGWVGCFTLPRELTLTDKGVLLANPVKEVESFRYKLRQHFSLVLFEDQKFFEVVSTTGLNPFGPSNEIEFEWDLKNSNATEFGIQLTGTPEGEGFFLFVIKPAGKLVLRRNYPNFGFPLNDRIIEIDLNSTLYTRIFFDLSTVEVFINHGETVMSSRIYPTGIQKNIALFTRGGEAWFNNFRNWDIIAQ